MFYIYRFIFQTARYRCLLLLGSIVGISYIILLLSTQDTTIQSDLKIESKENLNAIEQNDKHEKYLNESIQNYSPVLNTNKIHFNQTS